jgi:microcystin-dependent protein
VTIQYIGELRVFSFNFAPKDWAPCNGQIIPINQNQALFAILGTTYGGNGVNTFALPNLQGMVPLHWGDGFFIGQTGGEVGHTLTVAEMPTHSHAVNGSTNSASSPALLDNTWAATQGNQFGSPPTGAMNPAAIQATGGAQPHENRAPSLVLNICIALQGIFPSRN